MPSSESDSSTITLRGPPEKLGVALTQVYEKVIKLDVHIV